MKIEELDFEYDQNLIAKYPASPRDAARLLVLSKGNGKISHHHFRDLPDILRPDDLLVFNRSKVFPARLRSDDKKVEVLFLSEIAQREWEVIFGGRVKDGETLAFKGGLTGKVGKGDLSTLVVDLDKAELFRYLEKYGETPLPPYIKRRVGKKDPKDYQNVFADTVGSAAAPTAGLHFTKGLIGRLEDKGIKIAYVTLHVGLGTFAPVREERVEDHDIHTEYFEVDKNTIEKIRKAKRQNRRVIAVGTTVVRVLETIDIEKGAQKGETKLFITPPYIFKIVDSLITNFHTPRSSLLALVFAFGGKENIRSAYKEAIEKKYRLFSYGDGMLLE